MADKNKWVDAVAKLIESTQEGKLRWTSESPADSLKKGPDDRIEAVFTAHHKGKSLRLYERKYKQVYRASPLEGILPNISGLAPGDEYWVSSVVLEFYDDLHDVPLWAFPQVDILRDLLSSVQYQVAGVKDFLDDILEEAA